MDIPLDSPVYRYNDFGRFDASTTLPARDSPEGQSLALDFVRSAIENCIAGVKDAAKLDRSFSMMLG